MRREWVWYRCNRPASLRNLAPPFFAHQASRWRRIATFLRLAVPPSALLLLAASFHPAHAADTLRVVSYNTLNYPGSTSSIRNPEFRKVLRRIAAHVIVVQEMTTQAGMNEFRSQVLNVIAPARFVAVPFNDGPDTDNGLFLDSSKVVFLGATYLPTALRDIAEYTVRVRSSGDTVRIYSLHLKASTGTSNEQQREAEAIILRSRLNSLPSGSLFVVVGDYNIYRSSEPAFQRLLESQADNDGRCFDPLNLIGTWNDPIFAPYHTQSPRVRSFDGGATGGMDDRFDIILSSDAMRGHLITSSITAFGNDGNHYNDSINAPPNTAVPDSIADALHNASDHLPVFANFVFNATTIQPPIAATDAATAITCTTAVLNGMVNPAGSATQVRFAWGKGTALTDTTAPQGIGSGAAAIPVSSPLTGLTPDTAYAFRVLATNAGGTTPGTVLALTTLPLPPLPPTLVTPPNGAPVPHAPVTLRWTPAVNAATYRLMLSEDSLFAAIVLFDSLLTDTIRVLDSLTVGQTYFWRLSATNTGGTSGWSPSSRFTVTDALSTPFAVFTGWNLLSLPYAVPTPTRSAVYPTATSPAYGFLPAQGYFEQDTLRNGAGFWLKFDADQPVVIAGYPVLDDTVQVESGWNLLGTLSGPVDTATVTTIPGGIIHSEFFGYDGTYVVTDTLWPGQAYWVKSSGEGVVVLHGAGMHLKHRAESKEPRSEIKGQK